MPGYIEKRPIEGKRGQPLAVLPPRHSIFLWPDENAYKNNRGQRDVVLGQDDGFVSISATSPVLAAPCTIFIEDSKDTCASGFHPEFGRIRIWSKPQEGLKYEVYDFFRWEMENGPTIDLADYGKDINDARPSLN